MFVVHFRVNASDEDYDATAPVYHDRAVLDLGPLCNVDYATSTDPADADIQINYVVQLMDHPNATEGTVTSCAVPTS